MHDIINPIDTMIACNVMIAYTFCFSVIPFLKYGNIQYTVYGPGAVKVPSSFTFANFGHSIPVRFTLIVSTMKRIKLMKYNKNIKIANLSIFPKIIAVAIVAPRGSLPTSPGKIFAGYLLYLKNTSVAPIKVADTIAASLNPFIIDNIKIPTPLIIASPDSRPFMPASMFVESITNVIIKGTTNNGYIIPRSITPMIGSCIVVFPAFSAINGMAAVNGMNTFTNRLKSSMSSKIPICPAIRIEITDANNALLIISPENVLIPIISNSATIMPNKITTPPSFRTSGCPGLCMSLVYILRSFSFPNVNGISPNAIITENMPASNIIIIFHALLITASEETSKNIFHDVCHRLI